MSVEIRGAAHGEGRVRQSGRETVNLRGVYKRAGIVSGVRVKIVRCTLRRLGFGGHVSGWPGVRHFADEVELWVEVVVRRRG